MKKLFLFAAALAATFTTANALTYNVTVPDGTNDCYIAGAMNNWSQQQMTKVDDTHYTIDIASATESDGYKYCSGPSWDYVEKNADGTEMGNRTYSANDEVAQWAKVFSPGAAVTYSIKHAWKDGQGASWEWKDLADNGDGTYSIRDIYGGTGCNWKSNVSGERWIASPTLVGAPAVGDSAIFTLTSTDGDGAITITKIDGGTTPNPDPDPEPVGEITIRVQIPEELSGWDYSVAPNVYYWTTGNGQFAEMALADGWYTYTFNVATVNFIVVNGGSWSGDSRRQSVNMENVTADGCYVLANGAETEGDDGSSWKKTLTATDCNGSVTPPDPEPGTTDYYLIGYINGADYGSGDDYANLGDYKFVDGTLKAIFTETSYVYVKTGDNSKWYLSEEYVGPAENATATLKIGSESASEKVGVPANVEITFTLTDNGDGTLTLAYATATTAIETVEMAAIYAENGCVFCEQDFRIYDLLGRDVTKMNGSLNGVYVVKCGAKAQKIVVR